MAFRSMKYLLVAAFSLLITSFYNVSIAQDKTGDQTQQTEAAGEKKEGFNPSKLIMEHVMDAHEFHFATIGEHAIAIPLPVLLYSPQRGVSFFSYSRFEEGKVAYEGYKSEEGHIVAVDADGKVDEAVKVYDFSLTRNVMQMLLSLVLLVVLMLNVAKKYKKNAGKAPTGFQNAVEPVITFVRDEVGKPNLGHFYEKYMPYLLTVFFFILINNLVGLIPGTANVTGNIAFTLVLSCISLIVILLSTNGHFWGHIFWPPGVPFLVKLILIPVELLGVILIKPAALAIRLFANMIAGHIVITCFILLIFIFGSMNTVAGWGFSPVSIAFTVFIYMIEILVAFIQAFIFTNLTAVFIGQSLEGEHSDANGGHDDAVII
ncbi:F0F1 ATP synthase subunit A [Deminuibacter soli]|uniref:ATP synthase subunit a n=1 Tax=Deminuibacter soli TaxID=2291815 RepID=A0A3E1NPR8_9BACT|nr:F0F1 ATP synthase subunit A [Deminuibacter soli]RFM29824.1 ATP synthase F0 subunit A [Deminuibacter soli]